MVPGDGPTTGAYLVSHAEVDKVAFTGSTRTGAEIMRLAASPLKRVTLELGGKSPNMMFADANLADAVPSSVWSIYYSAGQSCEARSRVLVEASIYDDVVQQFADAAAQLKVGDPLDAETQVGSLISGNHRQKVHAYVEQGRDEGAEVVAGGELRNGNGAYYPPTVLARVDNYGRSRRRNLRACRDDHPVRRRKGRRADRQRHEYGLYATVWTGDPARGHRIAGRLKSGSVGVNMPYTAFPGIPFGGYKQSGFGRELGIDTLEL